MVPMGFGLADQEDNELNNNSVETANDSEDSLDVAEEDSVEVSSTLSDVEEDNQQEDVETEGTSENIGLIDTVLTEEDLIEKLQNTRLMTVAHTL